jgi:hypothetical protein
MITLTNDQQNALEAFSRFMTDPTESVFVLSGYSGTGKTTLVKTLLEQMPNFMKTDRLLTPKANEYQIELTATTNKAAENFSQLSGKEVNTIHSYLGLRVNTNYETGVTTLVPRSMEPKHGILLFIDEASYVNSNLLRLIFKLTKDCKIVFIGDPAQLTPIKSSGTPVFTAHFPGAHLSQVVRQAEGNPIVDLSTKFRETVNSGEFFSFTPDGHSIKYLERSDFNKAIESEFTRPDWKYQDSKVLAWTNKCTIGYNHAVRDHVKGNPNFQVGDYTVCNKYVQVGNKNIKTDQLVQITGISPDTSEYDVAGNLFTLDNCISVFMPKSLADKNALIKKARAAEQFSIVERADNQWIDLRAAYAQTVNKSQGSTYDRVFIDLDDIKRCNSGDQIARMLYVGVSRARQQVFLTGDIA